MKLIEVKEGDKKLTKEFLYLPIKLYQKDPNWIRPLDKDIEAVFDREKNPSFKFGDLIRWIVQDEKGETIARLAAFYDSRTVNKGNNQPTGGIGFFECIQNQAVAFMLFDAAKAWLEKQGMEAMDGSINFGGRNRWWGVLVEGFVEPNYCTPYNFPYYKDLFEAYGFKDYYQQFTYYRAINGPKLGETFYKKAERLRKNKSYTFAHIDKKNLDKYVEDFRTVYNASWVKHEGVAEITTEEARASLNDLRPILDERIIWFAYYNDQPIAFMVMIPELNQLFKYVNGKLDLLGKAKFVYHRWRGRCTKILGLVIGVLPRFHGRGIESAMIAEFSHVAYSESFPYLDLEFNWVGDFLPAMSHVYESFEAKVQKIHITYRKLFDETKEFTRHPVIK